MRIRTFVLLAALVAAHSATALAEDAKDVRTVLSEAAKALGMDSLKTLHYSGSGSSYVVTEGPAPAGGWPHNVMKSYVRDLNLESMASQLPCIGTTRTSTARWFQL